MRKTVLLTYLFLLTSVCTWSQKYLTPPNLPAFDQRKWHFGFTLGPEFQNFRIKNNGQNIIGETNFETPNARFGTVEKAYYYSEVPSLTIGLHVGIITSRKLGEYFNIRAIPTLSIGQRTVQSKLYVEEDVNSTSGTYQYSTDESIITTTIKSTYISLPVLLKYKSVRIGNARPYMVSGVNVKYDLSTDHEDPITLKPFDTYLEFGLGSDFYLETFRLGIEIRFGVGLNNILDPDRPEDDEMPYITSSMESIKAKTFTIAFNFE